jgi:hypothetical protein
VSGLEAAQAVQAQAILDGRVVSGDPGAWPIRIAQPESYPDGQLSLLKLMLAPYAYAAKSWSWMQERLEPGGGALPQADLSSALSRLAGMPYAAVAAWVETASRAWLDAFGLGRRVR